MHLKKEPSGDPLKVEIVEEPIEEEFCRETADDMHPITEAYVDPGTGDIKFELIQVDPVLSVPSFFPQDTLWHDIDR